MKYQLQYKTYGASALLIEWPSKLQEAILQDVLHFKLKITQAKHPDIIQLTHAYHTLLVVFNPIHFNADVALKWLQHLYEATVILQETVKRLWRIPVCYDSSFGVDLETVSEEKGMSIAELIAKHTAPKYTVYFIGFLPGFLYLGGLDERLALPRRGIPRLKVKPGAVAIGGNQTGIYPSESPGGWHIIGNSPLCYFDASKTPPCFAAPGDQIQFYSISLKAHAQVKVLADAGVYQIENEISDD